MIGPGPQCSRRRVPSTASTVGCNLSVFEGEPRGSDRRRPVPTLISRRAARFFARAEFQTRREGPPVGASALCDASVRRWLVTDFSRKTESFRRVGSVGTAVRVASRQTRSGTRKLGGLGIGDNSQLRADRGGRRNSRASAQATAAFTTTTASRDEWTSQCWLRRRRTGAELTN